MKKTRNRRLKSNLLMMLTPLLGLALVLGVSGLRSNKTFLMPTYSDDFVYEIKLDNTNVPNALSNMASTFDAVIQKDVAFSYVAAKQGGHATLEEQGSISNAPSTQITAIKYFVLDYVGGEPKLYTAFVENGTYRSEGAVTSEVRKNVDDLPYFFKIVNSSEEQMVINSL